MYVFGCVGFSAASGAWRIFPCAAWPSQSWCVDSRADSAVAAGRLSYLMAFGLLVPRPGIEPMSPALQAWILNHWTTREVLHPNLWKDISYSFWKCKAKNQGANPNVTEEPHAVFTRRSPVPVRKGVATSPCGRAVCSLQQDAFTSEQPR